MPETRRYRVILLEDNDEDAEQLQALARRADVDVIRTSTVLQTIEALRGGRTDLVIFDIMLAREDSLDILDYIKESESGARTIAISQHAYRLDTMKRLAHADEIFAKPVSHALLVAAIDRLLPLPASAARRDTSASRLDAVRGVRQQYDVAFSFAGEDRAYVARVAEEVRMAGRTVFYDEYERASLWGKDLYQHLDDIYRAQALFTVIFVSQHYCNKNWTRHELRSAQARAFEEHREYILPVRLDDTEIAGVLATTGFVDGRRTTPVELAALIGAKLAEHRR